MRDVCVFLLLCVGVRFGVWFCCDCVVLVCSCAYVVVRCFVLFRVLRLFCLFEVVVVLLRDLLCRCFCVCWCMPCLLWLHRLLQLFAIVIVIGVAIVMVIVYCVMFSV